MFFSYTFANKLFIVWSFRNDLKFRLVIMRQDGFPKTFARGIYLNWMKDSITYSIPVLSEAATPLINYSEKLRHAENGIQIKLNF